MPARRAYMKALVVNDVLGVTSAKAQLPQAVPAPVLRQLLASPVPLIQVLVVLSTARVLFPGQEWRAGTAPSVCMHLSMCPCGCNV